MNKAQRASDAKWWRDVAKWREEKFYSDAINTNAGLCAHIQYHPPRSSADEIGYDDRHRRRNQLNVMRPDVTYNCDNYWWLQPYYSRESNDERIIACGLIAAMIETGDLDPGWDDED